MFLYGGYANLRRSVSRQVHASCWVVSHLKKTKLLELQKNGIGERRGEGFGRIVFGWQSECKSKDTYTLRKANKKKPEKPSGEIPEQTRDIVQTIVKDFISKKWNSAPCVK